jgi:hypothetical protein
VYESDYLICANDGVGAWATRPRGHAGYVPFILLDPTTNARMVLIFEQLMVSTNTSLLGCCSGDRFDGIRERRCTDA